MLKRNPFNRLRQWLSEYGKSGTSDKEAVGSYLEIEGKDTAGGLRAELLAVTRGEFDEEVFDRLVGRARKARHGSYQRWAALMLQWLASGKS